MLLDFYPLKCQSRVNASQPTFAFTATDLFTQYPTDSLVLFSSSLLHCRETTHKINGLSDSCSKLEALLHYYQYATYCTRKIIPITLSATVPINFLNSSSLFRPLNCFVCFHHYGWPIVMSFRSNLSLIRFLTSWSQNTKIGLETLL